MVEWMNEYAYYCISVQSIFLFLACLLPQPSQLSHASFIFHPSVGPPHCCPRPYPSFVPQFLTTPLLLGWWYLDPPSSGPRLLPASSLSGSAYTLTTVDWRMVLFCTRASVSCLSVFPSFIQQMFEHLLCIKPCPWCWRYSSTQDKTLFFVELTMEWKHYMNNIMVGTAICYAGKQSRAGGRKEGVEGGEWDMCSPLFKHSFPSLLHLRVAPIHPLRLRSGLILSGKPSWTAGQAEGGAFPGVPQYLVWAHHTWLGFILVTFLHPCLSCELLKARTGSHPSLFLLS